jgi:hypothetical protein
LRLLKRSHAASFRGTVHRPPSIRRQAVGPQRCNSGSDNADDADGRAPTFSGAAADGTVRAWPSRRNVTSMPILRGQPVIVRQPTLADSLGIMLVFGTTDSAAADLLLTQLINAACEGNAANLPGEDQINRALAAVHGIGAIDQIEAMLAPIDPRLPKSFDHRRSIRSAESTCGQRLYLFFHFTLGAPPLSSELPAKISSTICIVSFVICSWC